MSAALEGIDLATVMAELRNQELNGHNGATDADLPIEHFGDTARRLSGELRDVMLRGDRQRLDVAFQRAARLAAFAIATQRRIRIEQAKGAPIE